MAAHDERRRVSQSAFELADLASAIGVLVLGIGAGALAGAALHGAAGYLVGAGAVLHSAGMLRKHKLQGVLLGRPLWWIQLLYLACWIALALTLLYLLS